MLKSGKRQLCILLPTMLGAEILPRCDNWGIAVRCARISCRGNKRLYQGEARRRAFRVYTKKRLWPTSGRLAWKARLSALKDTVRCADRDQIYQTPGQGTHQSSEVEVGENRGVEV